MDLPEIVGIVAGVFTAVSLLPQLIKILKEKKVEDLSTGMFVTLVIGLSLWVIYGIMRKDWPIIVTNGFSVIINLIILALNKKYSKDT